MHLAAYDRLRPYKGRVIPNFLARDRENAWAVYEASRRTALIGVMTAHFDSVAACIDHVRALLEVLPAVSVGLGDGQPQQWANVVAVARATNPGHVNQVFPAAGYTLGALAAAGLDKNVVNALIRPSGTPGQVIVSTGPVSGGGEPALVKADTAAAMLADVGVQSVKFFPIGGDARLPEVFAMAKAAAARGIPVFEPTGGLNEHNVAAVVRTCLEAGAQWVIPHLYTSMIDKTTGLTDTGKVEQVMEALDRILD